jgi:hypothetical protein
MIFCLNPPSEVLMRLMIASPRHISVNGEWNFLPVTQYSGVINSITERRFTLEIHDHRIGHGIPFGEFRQICFDYKANGDLIKQAALLPSNKK